MTEGIIIQILLIMISALYSASESSAVQINDIRLEKLVRTGSRRAKRIKKLTERPKVFLSTDRAVTVILYFIAASFSALSFSEQLAGFFISRTGGAYEKPFEYISVLLTSLLSAFFMLIFGELIPRRSAVKNPEQTALRLSLVLLIFISLAVPFERLTYIITTAFLRFIGIGPEKEESVTEEEILMMSDAGAESGAIDEDENEIIKNVFAFDDLTAGQICTHRTEVSVLWSSDEPETWEEIIHLTRHSLFPVCGESVDNVIGVLNAKDYFRLEDKSRENIMENAVHEPYYVHENMKADRLFAHMKKNGANHFAVVVDEYGGMSGIVTITDLVEELVGDFDEDPEESAEKIERINENEWLITGLVSLEDVNEELEIELPSEKYDTFSGYVTSLLGEIPHDGEQTSATADGLHIEVLKISRHRAELCRVTKYQTMNVNPADEE